MDKRALGYVLVFWLLVAAFIGLVWGVVALCQHFDSPWPLLLICGMPSALFLSLTVYAEAAAAFAKEDRKKPQRRPR